MNPRKMSLRTRFFLLVALGSIVTATAAYVLHFRFLDNLERQTIDLRFSLRGDEAAPLDVVIVKVDDVTFGAERAMAVPADDARSAVREDCQGQAEGSRLRHPVLGVRHDRGGQRARQRAVPHPGLTVLSTTEVDEKGEANLIFDSAALKELGARAGNANLPTDKDGIIRRFPYEVEGLKGFAIVGAEIARGRRSPRRDGGRPPVDRLRRPPGTVTSYSYSRVLNGKVPPSVFKDKVVVIGATAPSLQDIHATPTGAVMSGPEIQANAIVTALRGFPLRSLPTSGTSCSSSPSGSSCRS